MQHRLSVQAQLHSLGRFVQGVAALSVVMVTVVLARIATNADSPGAPSNRNGRTGYFWQATRRWARYRTTTLSAGQCHQPREPTDGFDPM